MAKVHILNVTVHNNPAPFFTPFQFEIHFECLEELQDGKSPALSLSKDGALIATDANFPG